MYKVLVSFNDPEHRRVYYAGDTYPGRGCAATPERVAYLSGSANKLGKPLIEPQGPAAAPEPPVEVEPVPEPVSAPEAPRKPAGKPRK